MTDPAPVGALVDHLFRTEYGKLVSVLASVFGLHRLGVAEEIVQETLVAAMHHWSVHGVPDRPPAWLMAVAKNKALNHLQRERRKRRAHLRYATEGESSAPTGAFLRTDIEDSQLRLVFACCHPDIALPDQLALVLKVLSGLGSDEIARALLATRSAIDKRLYRAKQRIAASGVRLEVPGGAELSPRLGAVEQALYLMFNEGYSPSRGEEVVRRDLCLEAMRLCRLLLARFDDQPMLDALMALMCLHTARFESRLAGEAGGALLADQDRARWDRELIAIGLDHLSRSARGPALTARHLEASIAAQHCLAPTFEQTDWATIQRMYRALYRLQPNPVVELNLAIVSAQVDGVRGAIAALEALRANRSLARYPFLHAALGAFYAQTGDPVQAARSLRQAIAFSASEREQALFRARLARLAPVDGPSS